eukprot:GFUD01029303.1.p1 GENE.GFUD01029303.1~~GFUD01029303.1.p1  ORF type:complete len:189 (+),score=60.15 GFUD01029303.1:258-824(+)
MEILVMVSLAWGVMVTVGMPLTSEYEYQYDEPQEGFEEEIVEKEVVSTEKFEMITKPLNITAIAGDTIELPCRVNKLPADVGTIWERPEAKQIVSIGDNLIRADDAEEYSIAATDAGNTLIIVAAGKKHEGQYKCKIATQQNVEVTHTIRVNQPTPHHQALELEVESSSSVQHYSLTLLLLLVTVALL